MRAWLRHAFSMDPFYEPLSADEVALLERIADFVVKRNMTVPAVLLLETSRPMNYLGSQVMAFFEPIIKIVFQGEDYTKLRLILARRPSIEHLMSLIEARQDSEDAKKASE